MSKLTVAIPTYNSSDTIVATLDSIMSQTYKNFDTIIYDNCSIDNTLLLASKYKYVKCVKRDSNIGAFANFNDIINSTDTDYLVIFHSDDIMKSNFIEREIYILDNNKDVSIVASNIELMDEYGKSIKEREHSIYEDVIFSKYEYFNQYGELCLSCPTVMFRMDFLRSNNLLFDEEIGPCADGYLWCVINTLSTKIYLISDPLVQYRLHNCENSQQMSFNGKNYVYQFRVHEYAYNLASKEMLFPLKKKIIDFKNSITYALINDYTRGLTTKREISQVITHNSFITYKIPHKMNMLLDFVLRFPRIYYWIIRAKGYIRIRTRIKQLFYSHSKTHIIK